MEKNVQPKGGDSATYKLHPALNTKEEENAPQ